GYRPPGSARGSGGGRRAGVPHLRAAVLPVAAGGGERQPQRDSDRPALLWPAGLARTRIMPLTLRRTVLPLAHMMCAFLALLLSAVVLADEALDRAFSRDSIV